MIRRLDRLPQLLPQCLGRVIGTDVYIACIVLVDDRHDVAVIFYLRSKQGGTKANVGEQSLFLEYG